MRPCATMAPKWAKMGRMMSQNRGFLFPEKMVWRFWGVQRREWMSQNRGFLFPEKMVWRFGDMVQNAACPFLGVSCFGKIMVAIWRRFFKTTHFIHHWFPRFHHRFHPNRTLPMIHGTPHLCFANEQSRALWQRQILGKESISLSCVRGARRTTE